MFLFNLKIMVAIYGARMRHDMQNNAKIYVAGHKGLLGSALLRLLKNQGYQRIITVTKDELDLTNQQKTIEFFHQHQPEYVLLAAGNVAGIAKNQSHPAELMHDNLSIQSSVLHAAHLAKVEKLIFFASSCMYPKDCAQPMQESMLYSGKLEASSLAYASAKLAGMQQCFAYNQQYGVTRFIPLIPNSAYGPNDNFDPKSAHVLSSLMARIHHAKQTKAQSVTLWGNGTPRREFIHADDIAKACLMLLRQENLTHCQLPLNIGVGYDISIQELAQLLSDIIGYQGKVIWDSSKAGGVERKLLDSTRINKLGWKASIDLQDGLKSTYKWFTQHIA